MENLTTRELDLLCDALDALEAKEPMIHVLDGLMSNILFSIVEGEEDLELKQFIEQKKAEHEKAAFDLIAKRKPLREQIILIKAKLIHMKDRFNAEEIISESEKQGVPK